MKYSEPIEVFEYLTVSDDAGGQISNSEKIHFETIADVTEKGFNRSDQAGVLVFNQVYNLKFWNDPNFKLSPKMLVRLKRRNTVLKIQSIVQDDKMLKYDINCMKNEN